MRILIFERNEQCRAQCQSTLARAAVVAVPCTDADQAISLMKRQFFQMVLCPFGPGEDSQLLPTLKRTSPGSLFLAVGEGQDAPSVVGAMKAGASHYWVRGSSQEELRKLALELLASVRTNQGDYEGEFPFSAFIGKHPRIREIFSLIERVKDADSNILITGESGTGKELVAQAVHFLGARKKQPWVAVNCGAIPAALLESELFGHMKGAFTGATQNRVGRFQLAGNGILFLDEISDLSLDLQAKILRALQNKLFEPLGSPHSVRLEARVIAASNQDLEVAISEKRFREDLYYRLNVIPIFLPPLRSRKTDIPLLVHNFMDRFNREKGGKVTGITEQAMQALLDYHWPGNVRELENLIERVIVLKRGEGLIELRDFPIGYFKNIRLDRFVANVALPEEGLDFNQAIEQFENELILQALQKTAGNKNKAATLLKLNRTTLVEKLKRKGISIVS